MKEEFVIRKFHHTDVEDFIHLAQVAFAEESLAAGIKPHDFARQTRSIFRWKMIPYRFFTTLLGVDWEAFVAEKDGRIVGGGMYIGKAKRMAVTNLMVEPEFRRQGIGQALLVKRLERLAERGFPYVTAQVLSTNTASLENLRKQHFEEYNRYTVYEADLLLQSSSLTAGDSTAFRPPNLPDRFIFEALEKANSSAQTLFINGSAADQYFPGLFSRLYARFAGYIRLTRVLIFNGEPVGFLYASTHKVQQKGDVFCPLLETSHIDLLPELFNEACNWLSRNGRRSALIEVPADRPEIADYLLKNHWRKTYTWIELIHWFDHAARQAAGF